MNSVHFYSGLSGVSGRQQEQQEEKQERARGNWQPINLIRRDPNHPPNIHAVWIQEQEGQSHLGWEGCKDKELLYGKKYLYFSIYENHY